MEKHLPNCENSGKFVTAYILLPTCEEMSYDIFFNILKKVVARVSHEKLTSGNNEKSFMDGMLEKKIAINNRDILKNWQNLQSENDQMWQAKLLGFWSAKKNPLFGKILYGDDWQIPKRYDVKVANELYHPPEIDDFVKQQIKFRLIQLDVSRNTLPKLKNFITVPIKEIEVENEQKMSQQMKSFDVKKEYVNKCFEALLLGQWRRGEVNDDNHQEKHAPPNELPSANDDHVESSFALSPDVHPNVKHKLCSRDSDISAKRLRMKDTGMKLECASSNLSRSFEVKKDDVPIESLNDKVSTESPNFESDQGPKLLSDEIGTELRKDAQALLRIVHSIQVAVSKCEGFSGRILLSEEKEKEVAELHRQIEALIIEKSQKDILIATLQKGLDAVSLMYTKHPLESIQKCNQELEADSKNNKARISDLEAMLAERDSALQMHQTNLLSIQKRNDELETDKKFFEKLSQDMEIDSAGNRDRISELESMLGSRDSALQMCHTDLQSYQQRYKELQTDSTNSKARISDLEKLLAERDSALQMHQTDSESIQKRYHELEDDVKFFEKLSQDMEIDSAGNRDRISELESMLGSRDSTLQMCHTDLQSYQQRYKELQTDSTNSKARISDLEKLLAERDSALQMHQTDLLSIQKRNDELETDLKFFEKLSQDMEIDSAEKRVRISELESMLGSRDCALQTYQSEKMLAERNTSSQGYQIDLGDRDEVLEKNKTADTNKLQSNDSVVEENRENSTAGPSNDDFQTDDVVVRKTRPLLLKLKFGWIKFTEHSRYAPGLKYPEPSSDGIYRALKILSSGYTADESNEYFQFMEDIPARLKLKIELTKLNRCNEKFHFSFE